MDFVSGCRDLNPGPLDPQSSALTKLRHSPCAVVLIQSERRTDTLSHPPSVLTCSHPCCVLEREAVVIVMLTRNNGRIEQLYVDPPRFVRRAVSELVSHAKTLTGRSGSPDLQADTGARRFYEAQGFGPVEETRGRNEQGAPDVPSHGGGSQTHPTEPDSVRRVSHRPPWLDRPGRLPLVRVVEYDA
jgi:hypothetical protein